MIYNTRNWSNDITEGQKEKKTLKGVYSWNKIWSLKSLAMLK